MPVVPADEARRIRAERWLRALGVARRRVVGDAGIGAEIDGRSGVWRVDPEATAEGFEGRTAVLSPFDRLTHDRARALDLFDFDYVLEMYKPKDKRRRGYFALPMLHHDQLVGKVDATAERDASVLPVHAVHQDTPFTSSMTAAVDAELHVDRVDPLGQVPQAFPASTRRHRDRSAGGNPAGLVAGESAQVHGQPTGLGQRVARNSSARSRSSPAALARYDGRLESAK
jgi:hypothetical protein